MNGQYLSSTGFKSIRVGLSLTMHGLSIKGKHLVQSESLAVHDKELLKLSLTSAENNGWSTVIDHRSSVCDCLKALQTVHHDHLVNNEVLYIFIFCFFSQMKQRVLMFSKRKMISCSIPFPFSFKNFHKIIRTISREFQMKLSNTECSQTSTKQTNAKRNTQ